MTDASTKAITLWKGAPTEAIDQTPYSSDASFAEAVLAELDATQKALTQKNEKSIVTTDAASAEAIQKLDPGYILFFCLNAHLDLGHRRVKAFTQKDLITLLGKGIPPRVKAFAAIGSKKKPLCYREDLLSQQMITKCVDYATEKIAKLGIHYKEGFLGQPRKGGGGITLFPERESFNHMKRKLLRKFHPDKNKGTGAHNLFALFNQWLNWDKSIKTFNGVAHRDSCLQIIVHFFRKKFPILESFGDYERFRATLLDMIDHQIRDEDIFAALENPTQEILLAICHDKETSDPDKVSKRLDHLVGLLGEKEKAPFAVSLLMNVASTVCPEKFKVCYPWLIKNNIHHLLPKTLNGIKLRRLEHIKDINEDIYRAFCDPLTAAAHTPKEVAPPAGAPAKTAPAIAEGHTTTAAATGPVVESAVVHTATATPAAELAPAQKVSPEAAAASVRTEDHTPTAAAGPKKTTDKTTPSTTRRMPSTIAFGLLGSTGVGLGLGLGAPSFSSAGAVIFTVGKLSVTLGLLGTVGIALIAGLGIAGLSSCAYNVISRAFTNSYAANNTQRISVPAEKRISVPAENRKLLEQEAQNLAAATATPKATLTATLTATM